MAQLSEADRSKVQQAFSNALVSGEAPAAGFAGVDLGGAQTFFCQHWDEIKGVLQFIAQNVGGIAGWVIKAVIAAGDALHGTVCPK